MTDRLLFDEKWLREAVAAEEAFGGDIQVGGSVPEAREVDPVRLQTGWKRVEIYMLLLKLLKSPDEEAGCESYLNARRILHQWVYGLSSDDVEVLYSLMGD